MKNQQEVLENKLFKLGEEIEKKMKISLKESQSIPSDPKNKVPPPPPSEPKK